MEALGIKKKRQKRIARTRESDTPPPNQTKKQNQPNKNHKESR